MTIMGTITIKVEIHKVDLVLQLIRIPTHMPFCEFILPPSSDSEPSLHDGYNQLMHPPQWLFRI